MKKIISVLTVLIIVLSLGYALPTKANPATLGGAAATVNVGEIKAINLLTVTEGGIGEILVGNNVKVKIPDAVNAEWDVADLTAVNTVTVGGGGFAVSNTVSYEGNDRVLVVEVTSVSTTGPATFTIDGLSYIGVIDTGVATLLEISINAGAYNPAQAGTTLQAVTTGPEETLTAVTATPTSSVGSLGANYTIDFTVSGNGIAPDGVISADGNIKITFPTGFDVTGATAGAITGISGTVALSLNGQQVILARGGASTNSLGGAKAVVINNIINPAVGGNYTVAARTDTSADELLATANSVVFSITPVGVSSGRPGDAIPPTSTITVPTDKVTITAGQPYTIKGTARDDGGSLVGKVEVSLDGGKTWQKTQKKDILANVFYWEYIWQNPTAGDYTIKARATDEIGNIEMPGVGVKISVTAPTSLPEEPVPEKPITEMTVEELEVKIIEIQQQIIELLQQLIQLIQQQIQEFQA